MKLDRKTTALLESLGATIGPPARMPAVRPFPPRRPPNVPPPSAPPSVCSRSWTLRIPGWHPTPLNKLLTSHWSKAGRMKKADAEIILFAVIAGQVPAAERKRTVHLHVVWPPAQRMFDRDSMIKSLLDGLVHAGALKDDNPNWCAWSPPSYSRGAELMSFISIEE